MAEESIRHWEQWQESGNTWSQGAHAEIWVPDLGAIHTSTRRNEGRVDGYSIKVWRDGGKEDDAS